MITPEEERLGRQVPVVADQKRQEWKKTWYSETKRKARFG